MNQNEPPIEDEDIEMILRDKEADIAELLQAILNGETDIDLKIAEMLEGEPEQVRMAILKQVKEAMQQREEEKSRKIAEAKELEQKQALEQQRKGFRRWLSWIMAEDTIRRLRETFIMKPILELKVKNIGAELAKKGVLTGINPADKQDLGNLSASVQKQKGTEQDRSQGR